MSEATDVYDVLAETWDTRELIDLIDRLEAELDEHPASGLVPDDEERAGIHDRLVGARELAELVEPYAEDYRYGAQVIRADHFTEYAQQLADDIGAIDANAGWPTSHIDWEGAARDLKMDYSCFTFDGCDWYVR